MKLTQSNIKLLCMFLDEVVLPEMVYLKEGEPPKITSIFQVVNPLTGKIFTVEEIKKVIDTRMGEIQNIVNKNKAEEANLAPFDFKSLPVYSDNMDPKEFVEIVRKYIRELHPKRKLLVLNTIQKKTPFLLLNPAQRLMGVDYGYADLLRFICEPVKSGQVARMVGQEASNPFYHPIRYPTPDRLGNERLAMLVINSQQFYLSKLNELLQLEKEFAQREITLESQMDLIDRMVHILKDVYLYKMNPVAMSELDPEYQRPMAKYHRDNYLNLLMLLTSKKRADPATYGHKAPKRTGIAFVNPELRTAKRSSWAEEEQN